MAAVDPGMGDGGMHSHEINNSLIDVVHRAIQFHPSADAKADYGNILARLLARQAKAHAAHSSAAAHGVQSAQPQHQGGFGQQDAGGAAPGLEPGQVVASLQGPGGQPTFVGQPDFHQQVVEALSGGLGQGFNVSPAWVAALGQMHGQGL